jgi:hypothetical protein
MAVTQGTEYLEYPIVAYLKGAPVRLIPDELVFEDTWHDEDVETHDPPFEGVSGNAAMLGKLLMECEVAGLGRAGQLRIYKAKAGFSAGLRSALD